MGERRRVWVRWVWRALAALCLAWSVLWVFGGRWMLGDVILAFQAQALGAVVVLGAVAMVCRRVRTAAAIGLAVVAGGLPLTLGRAWTRPGVDLATAPAAGTLRVVTCNINPENEGWREDLSEIMSWQPDVIILIEVSADLWRAIVRREVMAGTDWPYFERRAWEADMSSPCFVLTRWPIEKQLFPEVHDSDRDVLLARVMHPDGAFLVGAVHPHSPRTLWRWRQGNRQLATTEAALEGAFADGGEPYIAGVDLNSGPAGGRAAVLRGLGLRMSKPILGGWGSFPSGVPGPLRVQLDDVWHGDGVEVLGWSSPGGISSDHRAVVVDVRFPG